MEKFVKRFASAIVFIICAMFIVRCFMVTDKSTFSKPAATDALKSAYADGESVTYTAKVHREIADDGYFAAYGFYYNPESGEVQLAVRWNDSVYDYTSTEVGHEFSFYLLNETTGEKYPAEAIESKEKTIYNFRRIVAGGVSLADDEALTVVMHIADDYESSQPVKFAEQHFEEYKFPSSLMKEIEGEK